MSQMVASVARQFKANILVKRIVLRVVVDPHMPKVLVGDCIRLRQVKFCISQPPTFSPYSIIG